MRALHLVLPFALGLVVATVLAARVDAGAGGAVNAGLPGVPNAAQARVDYMLKCQGCHQPDGQGNPANTPPLAGEVARFLSVPGGREFLGRVPGVASVDLDNIRTAQVLNYALFRFDRDHVPADFKPYTADEIGQLRSRPLRLERATMRAQLIEHLEAGKEVPKTHQE
ncbi:c-type cytochrome [Novosphingobium mathurense]|uniref:Cytochrome c domain-containing protein n=1 Tax=Novosphingobium mathurense TaxID=428990 RepID=A0A1U6I2J2_9SPHN|nr:cytochrome c [Novosphingobium mathurense]SLK02243.1 hypothetical protein SAMN06295987_10465 [Novosphingobium mathurense]